MSSVDNSRAWALLVIAVPFLAVGGFGFLRTSRFVLHAEAAHGVVVSSSTRGDGQYMTFIGYPEVITFSDSSGNAHTTTLYNGQPSNRQPGTTVKLLYWRTNPVGTARYGDAKQLWGMSGGLLFIGALWLFGMFRSWNRGN
ncbi:DUF3592 domain-containing protein [Archangium lansingense]|uniref:DUF3592 domain-containing protein n=1 Tax=Archangium lansingense TaxID=2995310 RepID=A0ABT3ZYN9_9BACT|nr:DUF3592 domain-containing protein [Archangium lansinium]MCY1074515.1 DUF3592 domain-containing protein [Archangium lansinium]